MDGSPSRLRTGRLPEVLTTWKGPARVQEHTRSRGGAGSGDGAGRAANGGGGRPAVSPHSSVGGRPTGSARGGGRAGAGGAAGGGGGGEGGAPDPAGGGGARGGVAGGPDRVGGVLHGRAPAQQEGAPHPAAPEARGGGPPGRGPGGGQAPGGPRAEVAGERPATDAGGHGGWPPSRSRPTRRLRLTSPRCASRLAQGDIREIIGQPVFVPLYQLFRTYGAVFKVSGRRLAAAWRAEKKNTPGLTRPGRPPSSRSGRSRSSWCPTPRWPSTCC